MATIAAEDRSPRLVDDDDRGGPGLTDLAEAGSGDPVVGSGGREGVCTSAETENTCSSQVDRAPARSAGFRV
jgi:hypothetical protein